MHWLKRKIFYFLKYSQREKISKHRKKQIFNALKLVFLNRQEILRKSLLVMSLFRKHLTKKEAIMRLKRNLKSRFTIKKKQDRIRNICLSRIFNRLIKNLRLDLKRLFYVNFNFLLKQLYISFFKRIYEIKSNRENRYDSMIDIVHYRKYKIFNKLKKAFHILEYYKGIYFRKILICKILLDNIKAISIYSKHKCSFYRKLHLEKYFVGRWKRTVSQLKNVKIANLKFISKFLMIWKKAIMINNKNKCVSIQKFDAIFYKILKKNNFIAKKYFYSKCKNLINAFDKKEMKDLAYEDFIRKRIRNNIVGVFYILQLNLKYSNCKTSVVRMRIFFTIRKIKNTIEHSHIKRYKNANKNQKAIYFLRSKLVKLMKKCILNWILLFKKNKRRYIKFMKTIQKIRVFKFIKNTVKTLKQKDEKNIKNFRETFLKYNIINLLHINYKIRLRERQILDKMHRYFKNKRRKLKKLALFCLSRYFISERFKKLKTLQLLTKIFYALKLKLKN